MSPGALAVLMLIIGVLAGALITTAAYAPELRRISRLLDARRDGSASANARVTIGSRAPGVAELAEAINRELDCAMRSHIDGMRAQRDFQRDLSALSHDIRTPLTGAKGYLQLAANEADPALKRQRIDAAVERIDRTSSFLTRSSPTPRRATPTSFSMPSPSTCAKSSSNACSATIRISNGSDGSRS